MMASLSPSAVKSAESKTANISAKRQLFLNDDLIDFELSNGVKQTLI